MTAPRRRCTPAWARPRVPVVGAHRGLPGRRPQPAPRPAGRAHPPRAGSRRRRRARAATAQRHRGSCSRAPPPVAERSATEDRSHRRSGATAHRSAAGGPEMSWERSAGPSTSRSETNRTTQRTPGNRAPIRSVRSGRSRSASSRGGSRCGDDSDDHGAGSGAAWLEAGSGGSASGMCPVSRDASAGGGRSASSAVRFAGYHTRRRDEHRASAGVKDLFGMWSCFGTPTRVIASRHWGSQRRVDRPQTPAPP